MGAWQYLQKQRAEQQQAQPQQQAPQPSGVPFIDSGQQTRGTAATMAPKPRKTRYQVLNDTVDSFRKNLLSFAENVTNEVQEVPGEVRDFVQQAPQKTRDFIQQTPQRTQQFAQNVRREVRELPQEARNVGREVADFAAKGVEFNQDIKRKAIQQGVKQLPRVINGADWIKDFGKSIFIEAPTRGTTQTAAYMAQRPELVQKIVTSGGNPLMAGIQIITDAATPDSEEEKIAKKERRERFSFEFTPNTKLQKIIYGEEPVRSLDRVPAVGWVKERIKTALNVDDARADELAQGLALPIVALFSDPTIGGFGRKTVAKIAKETSEAGIIKMLPKIFKGTEEETAALARQLVDKKTVDEVEDTIRRFHVESYDNITSGATTAARGVDEAIPATGAIDEVAGVVDEVPVVGNALKATEQIDETIPASKEIQSLIDEGIGKQAGKAFVSEPVERSANKLDNIFVKADTAVGSNAAKKVIEFNNPKVVNSIDEILPKAVDGVKQAPEALTLKPVIKELEAQGFDGVIVRGANPKMIPFKTSQVKNATEVFTRAEDIAPKTVKEMVRPPATKMMTERQALNARIQNYARGVREGRVTSKKEIKATQKELADFVRENIPSGQRWKYITAVRKATTPEKLEKALVLAADDAAVIAEETTKKARLGSKRNKIRYLQDIYTMSPKVLKDVRMQKGLPRIAEMSEEQLDEVIDELTTRGKTKLPGTRIIPNEVTDEMEQAVAKQSTSFKERQAGKLKETGEATYKALDKALGVTSTRLKKIGEGLKQSVRRYEYDTKSQVAKRMKVLKPLFNGINKVRKQNPEDYRILDFRLKNNNLDGAVEIAKKYGLEKDVLAAREVLEQIYKEAKEVGYETGYLEDYWPRFVNDTSKFLDYMRNTDEWSMIEETFRRAEDELRRPLTDEEKVKMIANRLRGFSGNQITLSNKSLQKSRLLDVVTDEMNPYYMDSFDALERYILSTTSSINQRKFFAKELGVDMKKSVLDLPEENVAAYVMKMVGEGKLPASKERELSDILKAYFNNASVSPLTNTLRNATYIQLLGNLGAVLTQVGDVAFTLYKAPKETLPAYWKAIRGAQKETLEDLGFKDIIQEYNNPNKQLTTRILRKTFKAIGMEGFNNLNNRAFLEAVHTRYKKLAKNPPEKMLKDLDEIFGADEATKVLDDLKAGEMTENVRYLLFNEALDVKPLALSEMPEMYLKHPNGRIFYALKSYTLKTWDVYRNEVAMEFKDNPKQAMKNLLGLVTVLGVAGATTEEIKDFVFGREISMKDRTVDTIFKMAAMSKYTANEASKEGLTRTLAGEATSLAGMPMLDNLIFDVKDQITDPSFTVGDSRSMKAIPVLGELYYWRSGRGAEFSEKDAKKNDAASIANKINKYPKGSAARSAYVDDLIEEGILTEENEQAVTEATKNATLTTREKNLKNASTEKRAKFIAKELEGMARGSKQRNDYIDDLEEKGILTAGVEQEIVKIMDNKKK